MTLFDTDISGRGEKSSPDASNKWRVYPVLLGIAAAAIAYGLMRVPQHAGVVTLLLTLGLIVSAPVARSLAQRVALNGSVLLGWLPVTWLVRWPFGFGHLAALVAIGIGAVTAFVVEDPTRRLPLVQPSVRPVDALMPVAASSGLVALWPWATAATPAKALTLLLPGADNYPHFAMFSEIRRQGAVLSSLVRAGDGSPWAYGSYPQGFHAIVASLSQVTLPHVHASSELLVAYTKGVAILVAFVSALAAAALVSLPGVRTRPALAGPLCTATGVATLWEPGQKIFADGFANFWLAAVCMGIALLLTVAASTASPARVAAVGGLAIVVAHAWLPLMVFGAPAAWLLMRGYWRTRESKPAFCASTLIAICAAIAIFSAVHVLFSAVTVDQIVTTTSGGLHDTSPAPAFGLLIVSAVSALIYSKTGDATTPVAMRAALGTPVLGVLILSALLVAQLVLVHGTQYYFVKYFIGFELVLAILAPAMLGVALAPILPRARPAVAVPLVAASVVTATLWFAPSFTHPPALWFKNFPGTASFDHSFKAAPTASGILEAVAKTRHEGTYSVEYFPLGDAMSASAFYPDAWFHAIHGTLSQRVFERYGTWRVKSYDVTRERAARLINGFLRRNTRTIVVIDPRYAADMRQRMTQPYTRRLLGWDSTRTMSGLDP